MHLKQRISVDTGDTMHEDGTMLSACLISAQHLVRNSAYSSTDVPIGKHKAGIVER